MLLYEKFVNGVKHIFGTLENVPSDADERVIFKDAQGTVLPEGDVKYSQHFIDDKNQGMNRVEDGKNITVWVKDVMVIPPRGQVGPSVVSIAFTTAPTKTSYIAGEAIDMTGAVVTATYDDETTADVTSRCSFTPATAVEGTTEITATYNGKTATTPITVKVLSSIAFTTEPTKKAYKVGQAIDLTGAVVTATYSDSTTEDVTSKCTFNPAAGTQAALTMDKITATYGDKSAEVSITVTAMNIYHGVTDVEPTGIEGLTAHATTKDELLTSGFSGDFYPNEQFVVIALDKELGVTLDEWRPVIGVIEDVTTVEATNYHIYYINGPGSPTGDGSLMQFTFTFKE